MDRSSGKLKQVVLMLMLQEIIFFMLSVLGVNKRVLPLVTNMLQCFSINIYALLNPGATLLFITLLVARKLDIFPDILN